jgi:MFS family permease
VDQRLTIRLIFLLHALATGSMLTRIPDIQAGLGIDAGVLGLCLLGQPAGAIFIFLTSSRLIEAVGTRLVLLVGIPLAAILIVLMPLAPSPLLLFAIFAIYGMAFSLSNVAMNVEADRVEASTAHRLMNSCHGLWSIGQLATVSAGAAMRGLSVPAVWHFGAIAPVIVVAALVVILPMREAPARAHTRTGPQRVLSLPTVMTLLLVGYAIGAAICEGAVRNWSIIFMRDSFAAPEWVDGLSLTFFVGATVAGRLVADGLTTRFGPVRLARTLGAISLVGLAAVVLSPAVPVALIGFAVIGIGVCVSYPLSTSAAARLGDRPASENVAAMTMTTQITLLGAPALLGWVADVFGVRAIYLVAIPVVLMALWLARYLGTKDAVVGASGEPPPTGFAGPPSPEGREGLHS